MVSVLYLRFQSLPMCRRPAHLEQRADNQLVTVEPTTTRHDFMLWAVDNWTAEGERAFRVAYGQPLTGPFADWIVADEPCLLYVPPCLRMPGDPALQGGRELHRRAEARQTQHEARLLLAECYQSPSLPREYLSRLSA